MDLVHLITGDVVTSLPEAEAASYLKLGYQEASTVSLQDWLSVLRKVKDPASHPSSPPRPTLDPERLAKLRLDIR